MEVDICLGSGAMNSSVTNASIVNELALRHTGRGGMSAETHELLLSRLITRFEESELPCKQWKPYDKAFACAWLNERQAVVGTKCNHLLLLNTDPSCPPQAALTQEVPLPVLPQRPPTRTQPSPANYFVRPSRVQTALWSIRAQLQQSRTSDSSGSAPEEEGDLIASMIQRAMSADGVIDELPAEVTAPARQVQAPSCGIHCVSLSPSNSLLASGGADPADCQIFSIQHTPSSECQLKPLQTLVGHEDWIFGCAWVTDRHIVTGSRDASLKLWSVDWDGSAVNTQPLCTKSEKKEKVRDVLYLNQQERVASLAIDGTVQFWDAHLNLVSTIQTQYNREVVCMATNDSVVAVGSQNHISFADPRLKAPASCLANADHNHGVRSLAFNRHVLSVGGGQGKIQFWDMRKSQYLTSPEQSQRSPSFHLQTGTGHLLTNDVYQSHFEGMEIHNACYAHAWDPYKARLLTVGGPLAFGLTGHYAAIWD